jgi:hypothetical protein
MNFDFLGPVAALVALLVLDVAALRFGVDSRRDVSMNPRLSPRRDI